MNTRKFYSKTSAVATVEEYRELGWNCYLHGEQAPFEVRATSERPTGNVTLALSISGYMENEVSA